MRKFLKIAGLVLGAVVLLLIIGATVINIKGVPTYEAKEPVFIVDSDSMRLERGQKLVSMICADCHMGKDSRILEGGNMDDAGSAFGKIYIANLTHPTTGVPSYTDGQLAYLLRTGVKRTGEYAPPWMPKFPGMADEDMRDIIAFLRSDHPWLTPSDKHVPPSEPSLLVKVLCNFVFKPYPYPEAEIKKPVIADKIAYGAYIANDVYQCYSCHSADFTTNDEFNPEKSEGFYGGGTPMADLDGNPIKSANITFHETGIAHYSEADFIKAVKWGSRPNGEPISAPMSKFSGLDDEEVAAIYAYLKTLPKIDHKIK
ncbi:MAG: cytochrome c [Saprospiraceae bacterium]|nr:MAG: cytochrome c [Saprospiraceae bacterium]